MIILLKCYLEQESSTCSFMCVCIEREKEVVERIIERIVKFSMKYIYGKNDFAEVKIQPDADLKIICKTTKIITYEFQA